MPVVDVVNLEGKKVGQVELADAVFGAKVNQHLLHEASRWYLNGLRRGTHKVKEKSEVSGAGRKLWKQKGTGRARVGSIRSPLWRHGGTVHGPRPRDYSYALPKKMLLGALRSALSAKLADEKITVVDGWQLESHKTSGLVDALGKLRFAKSASALRRAKARPSGSFKGCSCTPRAFARSGKKADRSATRRNDCSGSCSEKRSRSESRSEKTRCEKSRKTRSEKGEGINHGSDPSLSDYSPPDHYGKGIGREGIACNGGL
jgi:large subunit ribosomal protein L4